jgi:rhodanese-related sulfurtransferase
VDAGAVRFRPMMLTAAAVIVGSAVMLFDPIFQGLAISLMAGEVASLLLSRMTVPVLFYLSERKKHAPPATETKSEGGASDEDLTTTPGALDAPLDPLEVSRLAREGHLVLDVRRAAEFGAAHVPSSINIGLEWEFESCAEELVEPGTPIILVADDAAMADEAVGRLASVGVASVRGFLAGGIYAWEQAGLGVETIKQVFVKELSEQLRAEGPSPPLVIDVRHAHEFERGHVPGSANVTLESLEEFASGLDKGRTLAVMCAAGHKSSVAASLLTRKGFRRVENVAGGIAAWIEAGYPLEEPSVSRRVEPAAR